MLKSDCVRITVVCHPWLINFHQTDFFSNLFLSKIANHIEDFDKFSGHLNEWANNCVERPTGFPEIGNYTLVKANNSDRRWNRAVVTKALDNGCVGITKF